MDTLKTLNPLNKGTGTVIEALDSTMKKMGMGTEGQKQAEGEWPPQSAICIASTGCCWLNLTLPLLPLLLLHSPALWCAHCGCQEPP
jgi:hypothetical protein